MKTGLEDSESECPQVRDKPPLPPEFKRPLSPISARRMSTRSPVNTFDTCPPSAQISSYHQRPSAPTPEQEVATILSFESPLTLQQPPKRNSVVSMPQLSEMYKDDGLRFRPISPPPPRDRPMSPPPLPLSDPPPLFSMADNMSGDQGDDGDDLIIRFTPTLNSSSSFSSDAMETEDSRSDSPVIRAASGSNITDISKPPQSVTTTVPKRGDQHRPASIPADTALFSTFLGPFGPPAVNEFANVPTTVTLPPTKPVGPQQGDVVPSLITTGRPMSPKLRKRSARPISPPSAAMLHQEGRQSANSSRPTSPFASIGSCRPFSPKSACLRGIDGSKSRFVQYTNFDEPTQSQRRDYSGTENDEETKFGEFLQMKRKLSRPSSSVLVEPKWQVPEWTVEEVVMWVNKIGFKEHSAAFADSSVDGDILLALSDADIRDDIGITNGIQRKRFMRELKNLKKNADYGCADDHGATANFLAKISPDFRAYTYNLVNNDLSYDYLLRLDPSSLDDMLKYVGIESAIHRHKIVEAVVNASEDEDTMLERLYLDSSEPTDIYISYPRAGGGAELASLISMQMQIKGYKVISAPHDGKTVSEAVKNQVRGSKFYVLILPVGALDNCLVTNSNSQGESQYQPCRLYWEVTTALQHGIDIIPVTLDFQWPEMTELPAEMRALCHYNFVRWAHEYQDHCIDRLEKYMHQDPNLLRTNADSPSTILTRTSGRSTPQIQLAASPRMKPRHRTPSVDSAIGGFSPAPSTTFLSGLM